MDIITQLAHSYWDLLDGMHLALKMLFLRWGAILFLLLLFGLCVRNLYPRIVNNTLALQVTAVFLAFVIGLSISLDGVFDLSRNTRNTLLTVTIFMWIFLPTIIPNFLIRKDGYQLIARPIIYTTEIILFVIQLIVLKTS